MGLLLEKDNFVITNSKGDTKFSLDRRMSHILFTPSGTLSLPSLLSSDPTGQTINRTDSYTIISDPKITRKDFFVMPFYKITNGYADTGGYTISGTGSTLIRVVSQTVTGIVLGTSILDTVVEEGALKIQVRNTFDRVNNYNASLIANDTAVSLSYKIYYGRFQ
jgi:hypothetical protein